MNSCTAKPQISVGKYFGSQHLQISIKECILENTGTL